MEIDRAWHGVRLRQVAIGADVDALRAVRLPAAWDDAAAAALCVLAPGTKRIDLPQAAQHWIHPLARTGSPGLSERLHALLLRQRGAPSPGLWRGAEEDTPGFVLNLPAFHDAPGGFDVAAFADAVGTAAEALHLMAPRASRVAIAMTDLAGLLALLGLDYASQTARDVAVCLAALLRGEADRGMSQQLDLLASATAWPAPPEHCAVPGLAEAAAAAHAGSRRLAAVVPCTAILPPSSVDALLGVETSGIAPCFSTVGPGGLSRSARAWLEARGITMEAALASALARESLFPAVHPADHAAMHDAISPMLHAMPPRPGAVPQTVPARREELPARRRGFTQKAAIGGHRVFLRTGEYADGRLGEIGLSLPRETATVRGLAECLATAVSLGLQHGVPLDSFVDTFVQPGAQAHFAPAGPVDGDPAVDRAASIPDYVFRSLAATYLGRTVAQQPAPPVEPEAEQAPLLPLDLPRSRLRLVA